MHNVIITMGDGSSYIDDQACVGCGVCVSPCPQEAIGLVRELARGEPVENQKLIARVTQQVGAL